MPSNNGTPASTAGGESLSPSNESRFVPRSSLYASPSRSASKTEDAGDTNNVNPPNLIDDDDKSLVVGATICFTPEASPRNTPLKSTQRSSLMDLSPLESALSSNATDEYIGSIIDGSKVSSSNVILTTSSLDGKSTTEYEILDKSLEIEDLNLGEEEDEEDDTNQGSGGTGKMKARNIDGDVAAMLENMSPTSSLPSLGSKDGEDEDVGDTKQVSAESVDGVSTSSPTVDDRPLTPFNNLHKFWEGQSITNVSKSIMGRILRQETVPDPTADQTHTTMKSDEALAAPAKETARTATHKLDGSSFSVASNKMFSYIVSVIVMIGLMTRRFASSSLDTVKYCSQMLRKDTTVPATSTKAPEEAEEQPAAEAPVAIPSKSKLFLDETVPKSASKLGTTEDDKDAPEDVTDDPLDMKELERLRKINSWALHLAATINTMKSAALNFVCTRVGQFFLSFLFAFLVMVELRMFQRSNVNVSPKDVVAWDTLLCVDTGTAVFHSVPMWEYILSPNLFGTASGPIDYRGLIFAVVTILASAVFAYLNVPFNSGYWNEKEHHQFLRGYKENGKDWEAVTKFVPTRSLQQVKNHGNYWLSIRSPGKSHPFSPKGIKVKKEGFVSPRSNADMTDPCRRAKVRHTPLSDPVKRAKMRLLDKGGQDTSEE